MSEKKEFEEISYEIPDSYYKWGNDLFTNEAYMSALPKYEYSLKYNIENNYKNEIHEKKGDIYKKIDKLAQAYEEYKMCNYIGWDKIRIICKQEALNKKSSYSGILYIGFRGTLLILITYIKNITKFLGKNKTR